MNNPRPVTISGAIRKRLSDIEKRMYEGERQSDIVAELNAEGIKVSLKDFRQLLYRAKKARKKLLEKQADIVIVEEKNGEIIAEKQEEKSAPKPEQKKTPESVAKPPKNIEPKPVTKMSLADIDNMLKKPLDLDNL